MTDVPEIWPYADAGARLSRLKHQQNSLAPEPPSPRRAFAVEPPCRRLSAWQSTVRHGRHRASRLGAWQLREQIIALKSHNRYGVSPCSKR
jgi:hypothetical protein